MPALTSSMWAPASTWASASRSTRLKSPAFISSASSFRPVGLMRSPMSTNGRSKPMTTSRVAGADDGAGHAGWAPGGTALRLVVGGRKTGPPSTPPAGRVREPVLAYSASRRSTSAATSARGRRRSGRWTCATPRCSRCSLLAGDDWRAVDGHLEARMEHDLARLRPVARGHLGGDVRHQMTVIVGLAQAPPCDGGLDDDGRRPPRTRLVGKVAARKASARGRPASAAARAFAVSAGSSVWAR